MDFLSAGRKNSDRNRRFDCILFRNKNTQKFETNLSNRKFSYHWNATFILIVTVHEIFGSILAMKAKTSDF